MARYSINNCVLSGNLGRDPEIAESGETKIAKMPLGITNRKDETTWANLVAFGKLAEIAEQYLKKGSGITVIGRYQSREYTANGEKRYAHEFIIDQLRFDGGGPDSSGDATERPTPIKRASTAKTQTTGRTNRKSLTDELEEDGSDDPF